MFASGDWTCTVANWKGKMIGPWQAPDEGPQGDWQDLRTSSSAPSPAGRTARSSRRSLLRPGGILEADWCDSGSRTYREKNMEEGERKNPDVARVPDGTDRRLLGAGVRISHRALPSGPTASVRCPEAAMGRHGRRVSGRYRAGSRTLPDGRTVISTDSTVAPKSNFPKRPK